MEPRRKTWGDVKIGSFIQSKEGLVYKVTHQGRGHWGLTSRTGEERILPEPAADAPVDIMYLTQAEVEEILISDMGAQQMGVAYDGGGVFHCPPWEGRNLAEMKSHLLFFHGVASKSVNDPGQSAGMNSKKALTEAHDHFTATPGNRWTPHIHTDKVIEMKETSWES